MTTPKLLSDAELKEIRETADRYSTSIVIALTDHIAALTAVPMDDEVTWAIRVLTNGSTLYDEDNRTIVGIITRLSSSLAKVTKERDEAERAANDYEASVDELHIKLAKANGELNDARAALEKARKDALEEAAKAADAFAADYKSAMVFKKKRYADYEVENMINAHLKGAARLVAEDIRALHPNSEGQGNGTR